MNNMCTGFCYNCISIAQDTCKSWNQNSIFLTLHKNIYRGYSLEAPYRGEWRNTWTISNQVPYLELWNSRYILVRFMLLSMLGKIFSRRHIEIFSSFSQKTRFDISCKWSPMETICMKCQILFSRKNKKKYHQCVICQICPDNSKE